MTGRGGRNVGVPALFAFLFIFGALICGLLPLLMPFGFAAGGVLQTGQVEPSRWWLGATAACAGFATLAHLLRWSLRGWWLAVLAGGIAISVGLFVWRASLDQPHVAGPPPPERPGHPPIIGIVTALPLFWAQAATPAELLSAESTQRRSAIVDGLNARGIDSLDAATLAPLDTVILAQPRLLRPVELVALDAWVRMGGRAIIFADPLLMWPSELSASDPRRAPLTSLLDPLLAHWGLRLEPVSPGNNGVQRRILADGHVLIVAGASRFVSVPAAENSASCTFAEAGLMALCKVGSGRVRLIADADLLDDRLWLADERWPVRPEAQASDVVVLLRGWGADPLRPAQGSAPRRVADDAALLAALRSGMLGAAVWVGLGWLGFRLVLSRKTRLGERERGHDP